MPRQPRWLLLLGALAAGAYGARRLRSHGTHPIEPRSPTSDPTGIFGEPVGTGEQAPLPGEQTPLPDVEVDPTGADGMVIATMEVAPVPVPQHVEQNGGMTVGAEPAGAVPSKRAAEPVELPPQRMPSGATIASLAALAGVGAILLGSWAFVSSDRADGDRATAGTARSQKVISLLSKPSTRRVPFRGSAGRLLLAIGSSGRGYIILDGLASAPAGRSYQAWFIGRTSKAPVSAAVFSGTETLVPLSGAVRPGVAVAITVERAGGASAPTRKPKLLARPSL